MRILVASEDGLQSYFVAELVYRQIYAHSPTSIVPFSRFLVGLFSVSTLNRASKEQLLENNGIETVSNPFSHPHCDEYALRSGRGHPNAHHPKAHHPKAHHPKAYHREYAAQRLW